MCLPVSLMCLSVWLSFSSLIKVNFRVDFCLFAHLNGFLSQCFAMSFRQAAATTTATATTSSIPRICHKMCLSHTHAHTHTHVCTTLGLFFHFFVHKFANFAVICVFMLPARGNTTRSFFPPLAVGNSPDWQSLHQQQQQKLTESQTVNENKPKS